MFQLTEPHQRLFWAGAERSLSGVSWMEGAVTSGTYVAQQIAKDMGLDTEKFLKDVEDAKKVGLLSHITSLHLSYLFLGSCRGGPCKTTP